MTSRPGDRSIPIAGGPWNASGSHQVPAHTHLWPERAVAQPVIVSDVGQHMGRVGSHDTDVFLLLVDVADLEPDVALCERAGRLLEDAFETLEARVILALLLVDYPESEQDLVRLVKIGCEYSCCGETQLSASRDMRLFHLITDICPSGAPRKTPLPRGRENRSDHRECRFHTKAADLPAMKNAIASASRNPRPI